MRRNFMTGRISVLLALLLATLTGCGRSVVETEVNPDGSWTRTVKLFGAMPSKPGEGEAGMGLGGGTIEENFAPPKGPEWKITRGPEQKPNVEKAKPAAPGGPDMLSSPTEVYTAVRKLAAGETLKDISVKSVEGGTRLVRVVNEATVRQIAPGRFEYREVVRWNGPAPTSLTKDLPSADKEMLVELKKQLPGALATPEKVNQLQERLVREMGRVLLGPNDPLIANLFGMMMFPDALEKKMLRIFGMAFDRALADTYGDALPADRRLAIARAMARSQSNAVKGAADKKTKEGPPMPGAGKGDTSGFTAMTFSVRLPGKIVESNGEVDPILNEVYWTFYSPAPVFGDVEMRAVCEVK